MSCVYYNIICNVFVTISLQPKDFLWLFYGVATTQDIALAAFRKLADDSENKTQLAKKIGISRNSLYGIINGGDVKRKTFDRMFQVFSEDSKEYLEAKGITLASVRNATPNKTVLGKRKKPSLARVSRRGMMFTERPAPPDEYQFSDEEYWLIQDSKKGGPEGLAFQAGSMLAMAMSGLPSESSAFASFGIARQAIETGIKALKKKKA